MAFSPSRDNVGGSVGRNRSLLLNSAFLLAAAASMSSCSSYFIRQECNKMNWFSHGQNVAMEGRRLTGDALITRCEQAEAEVDRVALDRGFKTGMATYCKPETVYEIGRRGERFNVEMCDGEQPRLLKAKHEQGVRAYCAKGNGYAAGATGKPYNNICPNDLEGAFLPEFYRGRKVYLSSQITQTESHLVSLDQDIRRLQNDLVSTSLQLSAVGPEQTVKKVQRFDVAQNKYIEETQVEENRHNKSRRSSLESDIQSLNRSIKSKQQQEEELRGKIRVMKAELATLP